MTRSLASYIKEHLVYGTGGRDRSEHADLLRDILNGTNDGQDFQNLVGWLEVRELYPLPGAVLETCNELLEAM